MLDSDLTCRVLIVDDDEVDRRLYERFLSRETDGACSVVHTSAGAAGLSALRAETFDCLVLDFNLPDMTGFEFLASANADGELTCGIILVTGHGSEAIAAQAMKCGAQDYLVKNQIDAKKLWSAVRRAVSQSRLRQRLAALMRDLSTTNIALECEIDSRRAAEAELRAAKDTAERANRAKSQFLAGMSHEFRTPLNGILGYVHLLKRAGGLNDVQASRVDSMLTAATHLLEMITGVLDLSEIESEHTELLIAEMDLRLTAQNCLDLMRPAAESKGLALRLWIAPDMPILIESDAKRLRQMLLNLLGNAVKFTDEGRVELNLRKTSDGRALRIEVADTGPGIPPQHRHRLFHVFERIDADAGTPVEGTGLGLSLSEQLAHRMGGKVGYEENPHGGSIFWVEVPLVAAPLQARRAASDPAGAITHTTRNLRVLVVDDNAMNREIAAAFLQADGHQVDCVEGGAQAVAVASCTEFDVILMDVRMPEVDGLEATRRIRALTAPHGTVPIVALTAQAFKEQIDECRAAGMDDTIAKPYAPAVLLQAVQRAAGGGRVRPASAPHSLAFGSELAIFDEAVMQQTTALLNPVSVTSHFRTIASHAEALLAALRRPDALGAKADELAASAHTLAGSGGIFGLVRLASVACHFERAVEAAMPDMGLRARDLMAALEATLAVISKHSLLDEAVG